jgi:hypothetical protein
MNERARFRTTAALRRGLGTFVESLGPLLLIAALPSIPMLALTGLIATGELRPDALEAWDQADRWLGTIAGALSTACISHGVASRRPGESLPVGASLRGGLRAAWPAIAVTVLTTLGVLLGLVLLIVPGLVLVAMTFVAVAVAAVEGVGANAALSRSSELARDRRRAVLAVAAVDVAVAIGVVAGVLAVSDIHIASVIEAGGDPHRTQVGWMFGSVVAGIVVSALHGCLVAATYLELRLDKEGPPADAVAQVFA